MIDYLRHIAVFSRVAEEGSFARAARSLGVPPSRVSESVSKLEHHVGVTLFNRTTRKISLTSEGRMLFAHTSGILEVAERGLNQLRETRSVPMGSLRISVPTYLLSSRLSQAIGQFIALHSQVHVTADFTDNALDPVQDGYDLCIRSGQFGTGKATTRKLGKFERAVFVGKRYFADQSNAAHPRELMEWDWITYRHRKRLFVLKSDTGETQRLSIHDQARLQVDSISALYSYACMDIGVAVMPVEYAQRGVEEGKLVRIFEDWKLPEVEYFAVWPEKSYRQSLVSVFADFLSNYSPGNT
ncbi:MAG: LysR family transcriptional regulator [Burkholderiaceae bacterium]